MTVKFVCLANSFKEGGRCLAGIVLNNNNIPIMEAGHPKWIRPISHSPHGEVSTHLVSHLEIMDIVEIDVTEYPNSGNYQSENAIFRENSIRVVGNYSVTQLGALCDNRNLIFGNKGKAVCEDAIGNLNYSLMLIRTDNFEVVEKVYEDTNRPQVRLVFSFNDHQYDFPITDPVFLHQYQLNADVLEDQNVLYLSLSLAVVWKEWYYKLVAGIIQA